MISEQGQSVIVKNKVYKVVELFKDCFLAQRNDTKQIFYYSEIEMYAI